MKLLHRSTISPTLSVRKGVTPVSKNTRLDPAELDLRQGDHVCGLYLGNDARDALLFDFLRSGLARSEKCVCIIDQEDHVGVLDRLATDGDVDSYISSQQLEMLTPWEAYLRSPDFSSEDMLSFWSDSVTSAINSGHFHSARTTGDTTSVLRELGGRMDEFIGYESELNRFVQQHPVVVMCLYNLEVLGGNILVDLMKTHPKLILGGMLIENPHFLSPDEFLSSRR
jgi:hypothetical protein